ncbi:PAS domain S-box protein [Saccharopolyspora phatthalungensis]|uniref:PAS domain S-box-containing protein n=1 Tax=Saccharopolyspora phatthalungensis TaxID=664693 RepID=A0A840QDS1_9PSEU|nr:PAS domain S-box protein [Saccharopolyspora phatthalungensis]MBB5158157.1 PAS domain S-box-containing protein [Saccharopolyspora phatthalungensis]
MTAHRALRSAVVVADRDGVIVHWSPGAEELFGHRVDTAVGSTLDLIVPEEYRQRHWAGFRKAMDTGEAHLDGATTCLPVRCHDGRVRAFPGRFTLLRDPYGTFVGAAATYTERTGDERPFAPIPSR